VVGLPDPEEVSKLIEQYGGRILPRSSRGVPDYAVVPVTGASVSAAGDVVTAFWVVSSCSRIFPRPRRSEKPVVSTWSSFIKTAKHFYS